MLMRSPLPGRADGRGLKWMHPWKDRLTKTILVMKMISVLLLVSLMTAYGNGKAQTVTLSGKDIPMKQVFEKIRIQTGFEFIWDKNTLEEASPVTVDIRNMPLKQALDICFEGQPLRYSFIDKVIAITRKPVSLLQVFQEAAVITGRVLAEDKKLPLEGVNIAVKGTGLGTTTDAQGNFVIAAEPGQVLVISFVGYTTQEVKVGSATSYIVNLKVAVTNLDQTVVVGYGTQSKRNVTGSIAKVAELKAEENITGNVFNAMQGRVAGLQVRGFDGTPGSQPNFSIRGVQTINSSNISPLIVVDGLIVDAGAGTVTTNAPNFNFSNINPQDIESIEVLKDASSSAIYGARGAQGVILITTKRGKANSRSAVNVNTYYGLTNSTLGYRAMNTQQYEAAFKEARQNRIGDIDKLLNAGGLTPGRIQVLEDEKDLLEYEINSFKLGTSSGVYENDWVKKITNKNAVTQNIQASLSGGNLNNTYYFSFGRYSEENTIGRGRFNRYSGKLALTQKVNKWLKIGADLNVSLSESKDLNSPLIDAFGARPDMPDSIPFNPDGTVGYWIELTTHPLAGNYQTSLVTRNWNYLGNAFGEVSIMPGLTFKSTLAGVRSQSGTIGFYSPLSMYGQYNSGQHNDNGSSGLQYTFNNTLTYQLAVSSLRGDILLGQEYYQNKLTTTGFSIFGFPSSEGLWYPGNGSSYGSNMYENRTYSEAGESYFMRTNLSWDNKYLLSASMRRDGTSKLTGKNRYSWFPALSAGWIISDEAFFSSNPIISFLKLKSGIGLTGNIRTLGYFDFADMVNTGTYLGKPTLQLNNIRGNRDLNWERTKQFDAGIEARFLNNKLSMTLEFYQKRTDGLLTTLNTPLSSGGYSSQRGNLGTVQNKGIDLELSYNSKATSRDQFSWNAGIALNFNRNKIIYLRDSIMGYGYYMPGGPMPFVKKGQSVGSLRLYKSLGVDPNTGDLMYEDRNKDGKISAADQDYIPVAQPKLAGGFNLGASWHGFSLNTSFTFSVGNKLYNLDDQYSRVYSIDWSGVMSNRPEFATDRWRKPGDNSYYPRAIVGPHGAGQTEDWNTLPSTHYLFDASYLRLRNVTLAYQFDEKLLKRAGIPAIRLYTSFQNVFVIKNRNLKLADPEVGIETGIQYSFVPIPRTIAFGIDITL
ncbi:TonB-linked SusC/RagA family outer membrane protein [Pseudobacter ginsenosidimutans]|uniref:TonB-linked SusC/RagA family outer membrane protein n=3 Tax=Pseudobacter ginsenosidimutans TaxID=661488 RepID=A0A4Q7N3Z8_9BACT|nr:TonB-linked SusC/RagA family outer membrane protein [Pseudobacter ginsenosidimutans]